MIFVYVLLFSCSIMSDSLRPHGLQHTRLPYPSPTPGACSNLCPLSQWCHPTISSSVTPPLLLPSIFSSMRVFSNESVLRIRWPEYWSFSFSISPFNEYSGLISLRIDQFDLLAVQGTLKSLIQHHSSKASILWCSDFFFPVNRLPLKPPLLLENDFRIEFLHTFFQINWVSLGKAFTSHILLACLSL